VMSTVMDTGSEWVMLSYPAGPLRGWEPLV